MGQSGNKKRTKDNNITDTCPEGYDPQVWNELPASFRLEILQEMGLIQVHSLVDDDDVDEHSSKKPKNAEAIQISKLKFMAYNVWFNESRALEERMAAIVDIIKNEAPDFVGFQEVTVNIVKLIAAPLAELGYHFIFQRWDSSTKHFPPQYFVVLISKYPWDSHHEIHYEGSKMSRCLLYGIVNIPNYGNVAVGTSHLESPLPPFNGDAMMSEPRKSQLERALKWMHAIPQSCIVKVVLGDMNWTEGGRPYVRDKNKLTAIIDGDMNTILSKHQFQDVWTKFCGDKTWEESNTYDTKTNPMLEGSVRVRADRILYTSCVEFDGSAKIVGTEPIPGLTYQTYKGKTLPILPSDHYGLVATLSLGSESNSSCK